jgi:glycosyltransferase involved in cell wall biosynthesis
MHIIIPVFFNAPLGGLQSHVYAQAKAIKRENWSCTILCKPGPFASQCRDGGFNVIENDFTDIDASAKELAGNYKFDLVHVHPFASRKIGQKLSRLLNIPLVITIHGKYTDELEFDFNDYMRIFCVSHGVRDYLVQRGVKGLHKILFYPNAVNLDVFNGSKTGRAERLRRLGSFLGGTVNKNSRVIVFACRMGKDKEFILNSVVDSWRYQAAKKIDNWQWLIAGDGPESKVLENAAEILNKKADGQCVRFLGWQTEEELKTLYQTADLVIAPGRSALDCLGCNRPVIAIGSKGYIGIIDEDNWYNGSYSNFGGIGQKELIPGRLFNDINSIINNDKRLAELGRFGHKKINEFYSQNYWDNRLINQYKEVIASYRKKTESSFGNNNSETIQENVPVIDVFAQKIDNTIEVHCQTDGSKFPNSIEYAFYLNVDGERKQRKWYTSRNVIFFDYDSQFAGKKIEIVGFARDVEETNVKFAKKVLLKH